MVQLSVVGPDADGRPGPHGARERNRLARHRSYLRAALGIVSADGLDALTMQRLADEVGASVGSVYTYFPSKGALIAEIQREAIERLATAATGLGVRVETAATGRDPHGAVLAPVVGVGRFWLTAIHTYPDEMHLLLLLLSDVTESVPAAEAGRVVPAALRLLGLAEDRITAASDAGALAAGDAPRRTIALAAALTGCVQLAVVSMWDTDLLDPVATGRSVLDGLLLGWGADPDALRRAHRVVDDIEAAGPLARPDNVGTRS